MKSTTSTARLQNDFGADLWVKNPPKHVSLPFSPILLSFYIYPSFQLNTNILVQHNTAGRGLFAGLQDTKHYNVDSGWAKRSTAESQGFLGSLFSRWVSFLLSIDTWYFVIVVANRWLCRFIGGSYKPPTD